MEFGDSFRSKQVKKIQKSVTKLVGFCHSLSLCFNFLAAKYSEYGVLQEKKIRKKYILAPQTTTISLDGPPNYQYLDSRPPSYHFMIF
jgi:hypothetical protein